MNMKKLNLLSVIVLLVLFVTSCEKFKYEDPTDGGSNPGTGTEVQKVEFVKDCTGSYIRLNAKDYKVCNFNDVSAYENGDVLYVVFEGLSECNEISPDQLTCKMAHAFEKYVSIVKSELAYRPSKEEHIVSQKMKVIKDCTGSYLQYKNEDYQVANREVLTKYNDGDWIIASFYSLSEYIGNPDEVVCAMYHANKGWVKAYDIQ